METIPKDHDIEQTEKVVEQVYQSKEIEDTEKVVEKVHKDVDIQETEEVVDADPAFGAWRWRIRVWRPYQGHLESDHPEGAGCCRLLLSPSTYLALGLESSTQCAELSTRGAQCDS